MRRDPASFISKTFGRLQRYPTCARNTFDCEIEADRIERTVSLGRTLAETAAVTGIPVENRPESCKARQSDDLRTI